MSTAGHLGWFGIVRLGLVQTALGSIVVLTTSTLNRVMVVELALAASLPGALVGLHYAIQLARPRLGYGSDRSGRRTPWIVGGMLVLASGGIGAAMATALMATHLIAGIALALLAFVLIGFGVGAAGTSLLVLLATHVHESRRAAAATIVWTMMIAGFVITAATVGSLIDPFSMSRLVVVTSVVAVTAVVVTLLAVRGVEDPARTLELARDNGGNEPQPPFMVALRQVWAERQARTFTVFVFVSMLAYSAQDLILEPFAGLVFGYTPGESTKLSGMQHGGVLLGMLLVAVVGSAGRGRRLVSMRAWTVLGCAGSAVALGVLATAGVSGPPWPLQASVFALGLGNGVFAVAAIGSMMSLAGHGRKRREGVRMGMWGAAQAMAFAAGGFLGAAMVDIMRMLVSSPQIAYASVFALEGTLFVASAVLAARVMSTAPPVPREGLVQASSEYAIGVPRQ